MKKLLLLLNGLLIAVSAIAQPNVTAINPTLGAIGSNVNITGTGFNTTPSLNIVYFGATRATITSASATSINVNVPLGANHKMVSVLNAPTGLTGYSNSRFNTNFLCGSNLSASTFTSPLSFAVAGSSEKTTHIADLDGDGRAEMIVANQGGGFVSVFRNISTPGNLSLGSFAARQDFGSTTPFASAVMDLDGDGKLDIVTCSYFSNVISVLRNTSVSGTVSFASAVNFNCGSGAYGIITGDIDGDGKPEVVTGNFTQGGISVLRNTSTIGTISFAASVDFVGAGNCHMVDIADFDGDGKKDICAASRSANVISVYRNISTTGVINAGSLAPKVDFATSAGGDAVAASDIDGDGKLDLVAAGINVNLSILRNTATIGIINSSSFASPVTIPTGAGTSYGLSLGDVTGDGKPDIFPCGSNLNSPMIQNLSTPGVISLSPITNFPITGSFSTGFHTAIGDLDNDGKNDIINAPLSGTDINVYRNRIGITTISSITNPLCNGSCNGGIILSTPGSTSTVLWSNASTSFTQTALCAGLYSYSVTSGTCVATSTVTLTQPATLSLSASTSSSSICSGNSATLTGNASGGTGAISYSWSSGASTASTVVSPTTNVTYSLLATDANSCNVMGMVTVSVNSNPTITVNSGAICVGNSFTINPSGASSYTYSNGSAVVTPTATAAYTVTGSNGACSGNSVVSNVTVNALPVVLVNSGSICSGNTFTITPSGASTYSYSGGSAVVSPTATAAYTVTGTNTLGCNGSAVSNVTVNALPVVLVNSGSICSGNTFTMTPSGASTYSYSGGSAVVSPTATAAYTVTGTNTLGCNGSAVSNVTVNALPVISAASSNSAYICAGQTASLTASGGNTYVWNTTATTAVIAVNPSTTTSYTVTGTNAAGCSAIAVISQSVSTCTGINSNASSLTFNFSLYPNPASSIVKIEVVQNAPNTIIQVYNAIGQLVISSSLNELVSELDLSELNNGIYTVVVTQNGSVSGTTKLIKN